MKRKWLPMFFLFLMCGSPLSADDSTEKLPELIEGIPARSFEILTPVGAGKKTIPDAREQLQREAKKVDAEAVIEVRCDPGGIGREGLTWYTKDAYCQGKAVRFTSQPAGLL